LAWLRLAASAPDILAVPPDLRQAARRSIFGLNNLAGEVLAEWVGPEDTVGLRLTETGRRLSVAVFAMAKELRLLETRFGPHFAEDLRLLERVAVRTSARNQYVARVVSADTGHLRQEVTLMLAGGLILRTVLTADSISTLGLRPGIDVLVLFKASAVTLLIEDKGDYAGYNKIAGAVVDVQHDSLSSEIVIDAGHGVTIVAQAGQRMAEGLARGRRATAAVHPASVLIGITGTPERRLSITVSA
jgi:molybdate transport system regulatory protein